MPICLIICVAALPPVVYWCRKRGRCGGSGGSESGGSTLDLAAITSDPRKALDGIVAKANEGSWPW